MVVALGVSFCCLVLAATGSVLVYSWPVYLLDSVHDNLYPYLVFPPPPPSIFLAFIVFFQLLAQQFSVYIKANAASDNMDVSDYVNNLIEQFMSLGISPFGVVFVQQLINEDVPKFVHCIIFILFYLLFCVDCEDIELLDDFVVSLRNAIHRSSSVAVVLIFLVILIFKTFVFTKYKRRVSATIKKSISNFRTDYVATQRQI